MAGKYLRVNLIPKTQEVLSRKEAEWALRIMFLVLSVIAFAPMGGWRGPVSTGASCFLLSWALERVMRK